MYEFLIKYEVLSSDDHGFHEIQFKTEPYENVIVKFGKITFGDEQPDGSITMHYDVDIIDHAGKEIEYDEEFKKYCGDFLLEAIQANLQMNNITYSGGTE